MQLDWDPPLNRVAILKPDTAITLTLDKWSDNVQIATDLSLLLEFIDVMMAAVGPTYVASPNNRGSFFSSKINGCGLHINSHTLNSWGSVEPLNSHCFTCCHNNSGILTGGGRR